MAAEPWRGDAQSEWVKVSTKFGVRRSLIAFVERLTERAQTVSYEHKGKPLFDDFERTIGYRIAIAGIGVKEIPAADVLPGALDDFLPSLDTDDDE